MGMRHGSFCVGCCWLLMALLFVAGVMNLLWVVAIAGLVLVEKLVRGGVWVGRVGGGGDGGMGGVADPVAMAGLGPPTNPTRPRS